MEERTADEIAAIFKAAGDSVTAIGDAKTEDETTDEYKDRVKRNVEHLEISKVIKSQMEPPPSGLLRVLQILTKLLLTVRKSTEAK